VKGKTWICSLCWEIKEGWEDREGEEVKRGQREGGKEDKEGGGEEIIRVGECPLIKTYTPPTTKF
jgi:hypothetical protein